MIRLISSAIFVLQMYKVYKKTEGKEGLYQVKMSLLYSF